MHAGRRSTPTGRALTALALTALLVAGGCSDDGDEGDADAAAAATSAAPGADASAGDDGGSSLLVDTELGPVQGAPSDVEGVRAFLAIPYAAPPTGQDAWRPPQPREPWTEPLDATATGPSCPQTTEGVTAQFLATPDPDPDCLSLDVWSPEDADGLPVMVWIHGGGFSTGSAHQPYYIGDDLSGEGVVVVNVNYRLGPQGFLVTEELAEEGEDGAVGNYGLLDQQAALEWVQANVAGFGGDPGNVTIFGESAGGFSVCGHLAAAGSEGLFHKAIILSGGGCTGLESTEAALAEGAEFMAAVGCDDVDCLRAKDDEELIAAAEGGSGEGGSGGTDAEGFDPGLVADGVVLAEPAIELAGDGALDDVPVLIGSNASEATLFTLGMEEPTEEELMELAGESTSDPGALVALYPPGEYGSNLERFRAMFTDTAFACPTLAFADAEDDTFVYHYTYVSAQNPLGLGATHGSELASLFSHPEGITAIEIERDDRSVQLSDDIQAAWSAFAADGDPGEPFAPFSDGAAVTIIDVPFSRTEEIRDGRCEEVNRLLADGRDDG